MKNSNVFQWRVGLLVLASVFVLAGCGMKGALYRPDAAVASVPSSH